MGLFTGLGLIFFMAVAIAVLAIWIWTLLDIIKDHSKNSVEKLVWILLVIFFPFLGTLLYVIIGRSRKTNN
ncbi:MAG TPA: PLD nuclease N-terminal domain-containing protein [Chitinophagaceae bacterium]|jgi:hypothetical protein|nr:PLD nuclease N-terminal domain-containing protein [Chitinophagaceae bacterium]